VVTVLVRVTVAVVVAVTVLVGTAVAVAVLVSTAVNVFVAVTAVEPRPPQSNRANQITRLPYLNWVFIEKYPFSTARDVRRPPFGELYLYGSRNYSAHTSSSRANS
jgi:hypothetical protein